MQIRKNSFTESSDLRNLRVNTGGPGAKKIKLKKTEGQCLRARRRKCRIKKKLKVNMKELGGKKIRN